MASAPYGDTAFSVGMSIKKSIRTEKGTDAKWFHGGCLNLYPNVLMTFG